MSVTVCTSLGHRCPKSVGSVDCFKGVQNRVQNSISLPLSNLKSTKDCLRAAIFSKCPELSLVPGSSWPVPPQCRFKGFCSNLFMVPKHRGGGDDIHPKTKIPQQLPWDSKMLHLIHKASNGLCDRRGIHGIPRHPRMHGPFYPFDKCFLLSHCPFTYLLLPEYSQSF